MISGIKRALAWLDDRSGYRDALRHALDEKIPGGASFAYVFGSILTFLLALQFLTGIVLAFYYSPSVTDAWASVAYLQDTVTLGWFVRGLHGYGASAIVIVAGLHLLQTALYGAYKRPRELNWIVGVFLLGVILAFALTGYLLPWDQTGYWATKVATGIAGTSPGIGPQLQAAVQGGNEYGNLTLTRFFAIHVFVLPILLVGLVVIHISLFRRHGVTQHFWLKGKDAAHIEPFWPDQMWKDTLAMAVVFGLLIWLNVSSHGVPLGAPADPASNFDARPEWYFRPLFQALKYFEGPFETVFALGFPVVVGAILLSMPFIDRGESNDPRRRIIYLLPLLVLGLLAVLLTWLSFREDGSNSDLQTRLVEAEKRGAEARKLARHYGVPPAGPLSLVTMGETSVDRGKKLWEARCKSCHYGPEQSAPEIKEGYNSRAWIRAFLQDPGGDRFFGKTKGLSTMEPVKIQGHDLDAAVEAIYAESGAPDVDRALAREGRDRIEHGQPGVTDSPWDCNGCHPVFDYDKEADTGPNLARRGSQSMLAEFIGRSSHPRWFGKDSEMPDTYDELSKKERLDLADYLISLRTR